MSLLKLAWKNIIASPLTLLLNIILFALGIGLINFLLLFNQQVKNKFENNLADIDMVIGAKGSPLQMILCNMYHVDNPTGNIKIEKAKPFLNPKHPLIKRAVPLSLGDNYRSYRIVGSTYDILDLYNGKIKEGKKWVRDQDVTIGSTVAKKTGLKLGDKFVSSHGFEEDEDLAHDHTAFTVVGILESNGTVLDQLILTNTASIWNVHSHVETDTVGDNHEGHDHGDHDDHDHGNHEGHDHDDHAGHDHGYHKGHYHDNHAGHDHDDHAEHDHKHDNSIADLLNHPEEEITAILIQFKSRTNFQALSMPRNINENTDLMAASPAYQINNLNANIGVGTAALRYLALLIAFISGLSIFISLFKSLKERKYELALMRVSGASAGQLFFLIIIEGLILGLVGFAIGIIVSHLASSVMASAMSDAYQYSFDSWKFGKNELYLLLLSLSIGFIASVLPAIKAFNTDINKTLNAK